MLGLDGDRDVIPGEIILVSDTQTSIDLPGLGRKPIITIVNIY